MWARRQLEHGWDGIRRSGGCASLKNDASSWTGTGRQHEPSADYAPWSCEDFHALPLSAGAEEELQLGAGLGPCRADLGKMNPAQPPLLICGEGGWRSVDLWAYKPLYT